jgi:hypothetical protein
LLSFRRILHTWWPLAASWLLMGAELPALSAVIARLPNPTVNLAAYGGVVFALALIIESPIMMFLPASTALSKDWDSFVRVRRYMMITGAALTAIHLVLALTPLYDLVVVGILGAPPETVEPARIGLLIMTPWAWAIAYRRFHQGVLIRFGHSGAVGVGTLVRLLTDVSALAVGYFWSGQSGIVVATSAVAASVVAEAAYVGWIVRPILARELRPAPPVAPLTLPAFLTFYIPLALTSLLTLLANPIGTAAISRSPLALASLATWPVVTGLVFMLRALGVAYNEVVVALLDRPGAVVQLRRFSFFLAGASSAGLLLIAATPLAQFWFAQVSALDPELVALARVGLWLTLPLPALNALQSFYQGLILHSRHTRGITESVVVYLVTSAVILIGGLRLTHITGLYLGLTALTVSLAAQTAWLYVRSRPAARQLFQTAAHLSPAGLDVGIMKAD